MKMGNSGFGSGSGRSGGSGRGSGQGAGQGMGRGGGGYGGGGNCICMKCHTKVPHKQGMPCTKVKCPNCGHVMVREELVNEKKKNLYLMPDN